MRAGLGRTSPDRSAGREVLEDVTPEETLDDLGLSLPDHTGPVGSYAMSTRTGTMLFVSGHGAFHEGRPRHLGRLGSDLDTTEGVAAAREVMLNLLATVKAEVGQLSRARCLKVVVFVSSAPDFTEQHLVANGATDLLVRLYGEDGGHAARSAVGVAALPLGFAVEIEAVFEVTTLGAP